MTTTPERRHIRAIAPRTRARHSSHAQTGGTDPPPPVQGIESVVTISPATSTDMGRNRPDRPVSRRRGDIGRIVAGSLATGLVAALLLAAAPFVPAQEGPVAGAVLC